MRHSRPHVNKFWANQNRSVIGLILVMFAAMYSVGFIFTSLLAQNFAFNIVNVMWMWVVLLALGVASVVASVSLKHIRDVRVMNEKEHMRHSRNMGIFLIGITIGAILFAMPVTLVPADAALLILFSIGGIFLLLYTFLNTIFGHNYHEIGFASIIMWIVFVAGALSLASTAYTNPQLFQTLSLIVSSVTVVIVFSITGMAMLYRASTDFHEEFRKINRIK